MKFNTILIVFVTIIFAFPISAQVYYQTDRLAHQIDSISKANQIFNGIARYHKIVGDPSIYYTPIASLSELSHFRIEGDLLIIGGSYFPLSRLLFFKMGEKNLGKNKQAVQYFEFYFQGY